MFPKKWKTEKRKTKRQHRLQGQAKRRKCNVYLSDNFAPVAKETHAEDLEVVGKIPSDVQGVYARTGPNPVLVPNGDYHW